MTDPLYNFQSAAADRLAKGEQVYLGFDPGLGKSRTALEAAVRRGDTRILVICPASGRYVWEEQVRLWTNYQCRIVRTLNDLKGRGVMVLTYGLISQKSSPFVSAISRNNPTRVEFDMTILDEAAALKNPGSNRTKAILTDMLPNLGFVVPLSGTPAPNHAGELYPILKALYPKALENGSGKALAQWQFEDRYCNVSQKRFGPGGSMVRVIEGSKNLRELRDRIEPFMLRVRKEAVLKDLPPIRYDIVPIGVDAFAAAQIPTSNLSDDDLLRALQGLDGNVMKVRHQLGVMKAGPAVEYIDDFMQGLPPSHKVLVFAHHREVIDRLMAGLGDYNPVRITGDTSTGDRAKAVNAFLGNRLCRIFIGNIAAAGTGLTLVGPTCWCSDVIFVEASYSASDNVQAAARVHRIGQREAVVARFLTAHGTLDDRIQAILARKARDFATLFN